MISFTSKNLHSFVRKIFLSINTPEKDAEIATNVLLQADLKGIDSHGVARLSGYVRQWELGKLNSNPKISIIHQTPSTAVVDGDSGLGLVIAHYAMQIAIEKAEKVGTGWVAVRNSGHFGIAGHHALKAVEKDMIGWAMTHASALAVPTYSKEKLLGTNPICLAVPAGKYQPFVADFASTAAAYGKLQILQRKNENAPWGWVQDKNGMPTQNPHAPRLGGALLPLGSDDEHGSHKGYCLGAMVDILSGVLSGANFGPFVPPFATSGDTQERQPPVGLGTGHFFGAMSIDAFQTKEEFKKRMDIWIEVFKNAKAIEGKKVWIPGEPEFENAIFREKNGIPLVEAVVKDLEKLAEKFGEPLY
ncbi:MAG: Ldh family oxidoreductase [Cytophagales bacterium]|nr:MAG: Ldh family oxidoreductase [Cytophagales bacterium]TAH28808.1 MAG: Ldh family oxidoreductase [Cytophagales bacterium]